MDVVTIGEPMVLFTPISSPLMRYAGTFSRNFGGAESNVAIGLARLGHKVSLISKVGDDEFGKALITSIRGEGVDVSNVKVDSNASTGLYFKEVRSYRDVRVNYYRKDSAASKLSQNDIDETLISQAKFLHITGITPALSETCYETVKYAISIAKASGVQVVFDPNLRKKLWSEQKARQVLTELATLSDIVLPGVNEGNFMFGESDPVKLGNLFLALGPKKVVIKIGARGAHYFDGQQTKQVAGFPVEEVIDPVGAGDGFAVGVISGLLNEMSMEEAVRRGNAVGAMVTQIQGDYEGLPSEEELYSFMNRENAEDVSR
ncbi:sugar kinase [Aquibacillus kalidii]|uniref:sugar kinase n=1 Tax=Aquibacillus kalidii TaxID=2762597 RepID=UPI00164492AC|nr:sugar kinase [Aquibacillus kalidii]